MTPAQRAYREIFGAEEVRHDSTPTGWIWADGFGDGVSISRRIGGGEWAGSADCERTDRYVATRWLPTAEAVADELIRLWRERNG